MPGLDEPNKRLRDEIEEILEADERKSREPIRVARPVKPRRVRTGTPLWMPTPEKLIVLGMVILLVGVFVPRLILPLVITGFAISGIGYYWLVRRKRASKFGGAPRSSGGMGSDMKYWRGRPIEQPKAKTSDGKVVEFPDTFKNKVRRRFGRKR